MTGTELGDWWDGLTFADRTTAYHRMRSFQLVVQALEEAQQWMDIPENDEDDDAYRLAGNRQINIMKIGDLFMLAKSLHRTGDTIDEAVTVAIGKFCEPVKVM